MHTMKSFEYAEAEVGNKGNQAVHNVIALALQDCKVQGLHICFLFCNLNKEAVHKLAVAVEKNTKIGEFTCMQNKCNFSNGIYNSNSDDVIKQAITSSSAPITKWNNQELSVDIVQARKRKLLAAAVANPPSKEEMIAIRIALAAEQHVYQKEQNKSEQVGNEVTAAKQTVARLDAELKLAKQNLAKLELKHSQIKVVMDLAKLNAKKHQEYIAYVEEITRSKL